MYSLTYSRHFNRHNDSIISILCILLSTFLRVCLTIKIQICKTKGSFSGFLN